MKRWITWVLVALVVAVLAGSIWRTLANRKQQQAALAAASAEKAQAPMVLTSDEVVRAGVQALSLGLPISGTLRSANSAMVKARVAGELQGLTVREGDTVRAGQVLARVDASEYQSRLRQAQEQADASKAQVDIAQRQHDNNSALVKQGFISQTALDTSDASLNAARATHKAALAAVEVTRKTLDDTVLRSPMDGQVAQRLAQPGERVGVDTRVVEIVDLRRMEMEAALAAADSLNVRVGQTAQLQVEGSPEPFDARVVRISPSAQAGSRSVLAYLGIDNPGGLRNGLFAQGQLNTGQTTTLAVPLDTVRTDKPAPYVQTVQDGKVVHVPVVTGARGEVKGDTWVAVTGLADGATVLRGSVGSLREGTAVAVTPGPTPQGPASAPTPAATASAAR